MIVKCSVGEELFCVTVAAVIVITDLVLGWMEEHDRARGMPIAHEEYTLWGLTKIMAKDAFRGLKARASAIGRRLTHEKGERREKDEGEKGIRGEESGKEAG